MDVFLVILVLAVVAVGAYLGYLAKKKRQEAFRRLARRLSGRYYEDDPFGLSNRYDGAFPTLAQGSNRYAYNVIAGEIDGRDCKVFDHHYETYSTDSKGNRTTHHHHRTFVLLEHDVDLGRLEVRPEGVFDKVKAFFGFDDVDFESEEFSRKYLVKAEDRKLAYDVFHPRMIEWYLRQGSFKVTTAGDLALFRRGNGTMTPVEIRRTLQEADAFLDLLPRYLKKDRAS